MTVGLLWQIVIVISFAHEHKTASNNKAPELFTRIVQSLTKLNDKVLWRYPLGPQHYINFFELFHFTAGDQLVVPIGVSHISLPLQEIQSREWEKKEQTNNMLGVNSKR